MIALRHGCRLAIASLALLLGACAVDPLHARRAAATAAAAQDRTLSCAAADACATPSPYADLLARARAESTADAPVDFVNLLEHGSARMACREAAMICGMQVLCGNHERERRL